MKIQLMQFVKGTAIAVLLLLYCTNSAFSENTIPNRWFFASSGLGNDNEVSRLKTLILKAKDAGFNGMLLDGVFSTIDKQDASHISRLLLLKKMCDQNGIELIPRLFSIGYAAGSVYYDKNFAASYPVKEQSFLIKNGEAISDKALLPNIFSCNFEGVNNNKLTDFYLQDKPGIVSIIDNQNVYTGTSSIKLQNFSSNNSGNARLGKMVSVKPYNSYAVSFVMKASNWPESTTVSILVSSKDGSRRIGWKSVVPSKEWTKASLEFNSIDNSEVRVAVGVWNGTSGELWIDNLEVALAPQINRLVRNIGTQVALKNAITGISYSEGTDFTIEENSEIADNFKVKIKPESQIKENTLVKFSYYRSYMMGAGQISECMSLPELDLKHERQLSLINTLIKPNNFFLAADEIRQGGYCELCQGKSMSKIFGNYIDRQYKIFKRLNPSVELFISSDMLDPNLNAVQNYFMTCGGFVNSWTFIPNETKAIIPCVWDYNKKDASLAHFKNSGFNRTVVSVNVDGAGALQRMQDWKISINKAQAPVAVIYTTWNNDYSKFSDFAKVFFH